MHKLSLWSQILLGNERQPNQRRGPVRRRALRLESLESRSLLAGIARFDFDAGSTEVGPAGWTHIYPNINAENKVVDTATKIGLRLDGTNLGYNATYTTSAVPSDATSANIRNGISSTLASNSYALSLVDLDLAKSYEIWVLGGNVSGAPSTQQISVQGAAPLPMQFTQSIASLSLGVNTFDSLNTKAITDFAPVLVQAPFFDADLNTNVIRVTIAESTGNGQARVAGVVIREYEANTISLPASGGPFALVLESGNRVVKNNAGTVLATLDGTSAITINGTAGASDVLNVDLSGGNVLTGGVTFNGGESAGDDDRLKITGYNLPTADGVADVTVTHTGAEAGNVVLNGLGTVSFTQIEPLALVGTAADMVITLPAGPNPDATLGDDGVAAYGDLTNDASTSAMYDSTTPGATFEYTEFTNPSNTLTINRGSATDNVTLLDLVASGLNAGLTIGAAASEFNAVTFNGPITLATNNSLSANALGTISLPAAAKIATSGTGSVSLTTARNITQAATSSVTTVNGGITFSANRQATPTAASFVGITLNGSITTSGTGNISLSGRGGNVANVGDLYGIWLNGAQVSSTATGVAAGTITITGTGGTGTGASNTNSGVQIENSATNIASVDGSISITGNATTTTGSFQDGIRQTNTSSPRIDITGTGNLTLTGTPGRPTGGTDGVGLRLFGPIDVTGPQTTLISNRMALSTGVSFSLNAHGNTVTLRPDTNNTPIDLGSTIDTNATVTLELSTAELGRITAGTLQIGDSNSGTISVTNAISRTSLTNVGLTSGGSINFVNVTTPTVSSGSINTNNGNLTLTPGASGSVGVSSTIADANLGTTGTLGNLTFVSGADLAIAINGTSQGSGYHQLTISGNVDLSNVDLRLSGTYKPQIGNRFTIVNNTKDTAPAGVTSGTFNGLPEGTVFNPANGNLNADLHITYRGISGTSNDVVLTAINVAPTLNAISDPLTILEGAGLQTVNLLGISAGGTISQVLTVNAVSDNPALIGSPVAVNYTSPGATGSLSYTPEADQFGTAVIIVTVQDDGGVFTSHDHDTVTRTFTVRVAEVNDAPTGFDDPLADIAEDSGDRVIPFADLLGNDLKGPDNESGQILTITAVSNVLGGTARIEGTDVIFTPFRGYFGPAGFTYTLSDDGTTDGVIDFKSNTATVTFTIESVNDPPDSRFSNSVRFMVEDGGFVVGPQNFQFFDGFHDFPQDAFVGVFLDSLPTNGVLIYDGEPAELSFIPIGGISSGLLEYKPNDHGNGIPYDQFTFRMKDDGGTANGGLDTSLVANTISFNVFQVNDPPTGVDDPLASIAEDSGDRLIAFADLVANDHKGPSNEDGQLLTVTSVSDPVGGTVQISGSDVIFSPTPDYHGPASFVYTFRDNGTIAGSDDFLTSTATVTFNITDKNDPPTGTTDPLPAIEEDSDPLVISFAELLANDDQGPADEAGQSLTIIDVFGAVGGTVDIVGLTVVFTPAVDFFGAASFVYTLQDDGSSDGSPDFKSDSATVHFSITSVNDPPSFQVDGTGNQSAADENPATKGPALEQVITSWAHDIYFEATNEQSAVPSFVVVNDNHSIFAVQPVVDPNGTLRYTPKPNVHGVANVTVELTDGGSASVQTDFQTGSIVSPGTASVSTDFDTGLSGTGPTVAGTFTAVLPGTAGNKITVILNKVDRTLANQPGIGISLSNIAGFTIISITLDTRADAIANGQAFTGSTIDELRLAIASPANGVSGLISLTADSFGVDIATPLIASKVLQLAGGTNTPSALSVVFASQIIGTPANNVLLTFDRQDRGGLGPLITVNGNNTVNLTGANTIAIALDQTQHGTGTTAQDLVDFIRTSTTAGAVAARQLISAYIAQGNSGTDIANPPPDNQGNTPTQPPLQLSGPSSEPFTFTIEITKPHKLHNASESGKRTGLDVTGATSTQPDGFIVAGDVLGVINYINSKGSGQVPGNAPFGPPYPDTNGDNNIAADDVIAIINYINAGNPSEGEAPDSIPDGYFADLAGFDQAAKSLSSPVESTANSLADLIGLLAAENEFTQVKRRRAGG